MIKVSAQRSILRRMALTKMAGMSRFSPIVSGVNRAITGAGQWVAEKTPAPVRRFMGGARNVIAPGMPQPPTTPNPTAGVTAGGVGRGVSRLRSPVPAPAPQQGVTMQIR